jgi:hypothetical protein
LSAKFTEGKNKYFSFVDPIPTAIFAFDCHYSIDLADYFQNMHDGYLELKVYADESRTRVVALGKASLRKSLR